MEWQQVFEHWPELREDALRKWDRLSPRDVDETRGIRDQLVGMVEQRYEQHRDEAERECDDWVASLPDPSEHTRMAG